MKETNNQNIKNTSPATRSKSSPMSNVGQKPSLREFGNWGEEVATRFLIKLGYVIVDRGWRDRAGEIDVIARDGREVVFVEVKTRHDLSNGYPEEAVTPQKQRTLRVMAERYMKKLSALEDLPYRIDVIAIRKDATGTWLKHFKYAVEG